MGQISSHRHHPGSQNPRPEARQITLDAIHHFHGPRYILFAAVVMPDHFHLLIEPQPKAWDPKGNPVFWELGDLMHSIKSFTAKEINKATGAQRDTVWQKDYHDRLIRSDSDLGEKFEYITTNPQRAGLTDDGPYPYLSWSRGWEPSNLTMRASAPGSAGVSPASICRRIAGIRCSLTQSWAGCP